MSRPTGAGAGTCTACGANPAWIVLLKEFPDKIRKPCQKCMLKMIVSGEVIVTGTDERDDHDPEARISGWSCEQNLTGCSNDSVVRIEYRVGFTGIGPLYTCMPCLWQHLEAGKLDVTLAADILITPPHLIATTSEDGQVTLDGMEFRW